MMFDDIVGPMSERQRARHTNLKNELASALRTRERELKQAHQSRAGAGNRERAAAEVMANAGTLCNIYTEGDHLVVECRHAQAATLAFARAIANADAVQTGRARTIFFYGPDGRQFAQADGLRGIYLK